MADIPYEDLAERMSEVRSAIDGLMEEYFSLHCEASRYEGECLPEQIHMTEFITVCAWQSFNDSGQRMGSVRLLLRDGSMPIYVARGILSTAMQQLDEIPSRCTCAHIQEEEDDGCS